MKKYDKNRLFEVMARVDNSFKPQLNENLNEEDVDESGLPRFKRMAAGLVPSINTIGIFSAENPKDHRFTPEENKKRMNDLKSKLRNLGYGFIPIKGKYGDPENSLIVPNIKYEDIRELSKDKKKEEEGDLSYNQDTFIFGEKVKTEDDKVYYKWNMIKTDTEMPDDKERYTVLTNREDVENAEDFYSLIKNKKFKIPFFHHREDEYEEPEDIDLYDNPENQ